MRKETIEKRMKVRYFCDICNKEVSVRYEDDISDYLSTCNICGKDFCEDCGQQRSFIATVYDICKVCEKIHKSDLQTLDINITQLQQVKSNLAEVERNILKGIKNKNG